MKAAEVKQMRLGLKIGSNDLDIKLRKIRNFLEEGHKVKIVIFFRGREMAHQDIGYQLMEKIIQRLSEVATVDAPLQMAGKNLSTIIRSRANAKAKDAPRDSQES